MAVALTAGLTGSSAGQSFGIRKGSVWKFDTTGTDLGTAWQAIDYSDSTWASGPAPLGFGEPFIVTPVPFGPDSMNKWRTTYFRQTFDVTAPLAKITSMRLSAAYDDGIVAYINGQEFARLNMPLGPIIYSTFASTSHDGDEYELVVSPGAFPALVEGTNILAVEVHQRTRSSLDLVLDLELGYTAVTRGPYLQVGTPTSVIMRWRTDQPSDSRVLYGPELSTLDSIGDVPDSTTEHEVQLTGLSPGTRYFYGIGSTSLPYLTPDSSFTFVTAPVTGPGRPTRLWILGDSGTKNASARAVRDAYLGYPGNQATDVWIMLGDNAYDDGTDAEYQEALFEMFPEQLKQLPLWATRGNHDLMYSGSAKDYYDIFTMPTAGEAGGIPSGSEAYYSFDFANIHFISMDSEGTDRTPEGAMMTWLANDLAATTQEWLIAFWHHPPYSKGSHNSDDIVDSGGRMRDMRMNALPMLEAAGVDLVLTGHSHSYERSFLLDGHYDVSSTLTSEMKVDSGDGRVGGDGPYGKTTSGPHEGTVYTVTGSSGQTSGGALNHPVMVSSLNVLGSLVVDVNGLRLEARFLDSQGAVRDSFVINKGVTVDVPQTEAPARPLMITASRPNPFASRVRMSYSLPAPGRVRLSILDVNGRRVRTLVRLAQEKGSYEAIWDGRDDGGLKLGAGIYFAMLELGHRTTATKLVLAP